MATSATAFWLSPSPSSMLSKGRNEAMVQLARQESEPMLLWFVAALVLAVNVPFGYWRGNVHRFSLQWFLAIHIPVVLAVAFRLAFHLPFEPGALVLTAGAFFLGQAVGQRARGVLAKLLPLRLSSCLVWDLARAVLG